MIEIIEVKARRCTCEIEKCGHIWISIAEQPPAVCPDCASREWNGKKKIGRPKSARDTTKLGLPKPKRVRQV